MNELTRKAIVIITIFLVSSILSPSFVSIDQFDDSSLEVLFIGSSYFNFNSLPNLVNDLALSSGKEIFIDHIGNNGLYLDDHAYSVETEAKINERDWDYVVLQGAGPNSAYPDYFTDHPLYPSLERLKEKIQHNCASSKMVYCMAWAFEDGMTWYQDWTDTYEDMQLKIYDTVLEYANEIGFMIAPVGWSWYKVLEEKEYPLHYLHMGDWNHPSLKGSYLMACTIFSTLFVEPSIGLSFTAGLDEEEATYFQEVASAVVLDDLALWNIKDDHIIYVDDDNANGPWDGTKKYPYNCIQDAIDGSVDTDTILVSEGVYKENILIDKELTLLGSGSDVTVIDGLQQDSTVTFDHDHCTMNGFQITNCSLEHIDFTHSLLMINSHDNRIENNRFSLIATDDFFSISALQINSGTHNYLYNNQFISEESVSRTHALFLNGTCENTYIEQNHINGFYYAFSDSIDTVDVGCINNQIVENVFGLKVYGTSYVISKNNISFNKADAIIFHGGTDHTIMDNQIIENGDYGDAAAGPGIMLYRSSGGNRIQRNTIIRNAGPGIYDYMSFDNVITENNLVNNGWKYDWTEKPNAFFYTGIGDVFKTNHWNGNYWEPSSDSSWQSIPSELRLFAYFDSVCSIPWFAFDRNPAIEPYDI